MANHDTNIELGNTQDQDQKPANINAETIEAIKDDQIPGANDKAGQFLKEAGHSVIVTPEDNKRILRKIDLAVLPIILFIYCIQFLDKQALSYASVFGLIEDAGLEGDAYSWLGAIVYIAQLIFQPLIAYMLVKFPIGKFCAIMVFCWGSVICGMAAADNFGTLMATRFLLGSFEASVAPIMVAIVQMWYRRGEQTLRNAAWYSMLGVVNLFGSLLTYGLGHISSDVLYPYQVIFLFCGLLTVIFAVVVWFFLPDSAMSARFLRRGDDKLLALERLRMNQMGVSSGVWRWDHVKESLLDVKTWIWFFLITLQSIPSGGISAFGPLIIESFGYDAFQTILFNMPFGAVQLVAILVGAWAATYWKAKSPVIAVVCVPPIIGLAIMLSVEYDPSNRGVLLFAYYLTSVYPAVSPLVYSWCGQNTGGDTKRKVTTAILFVGQSAGNIGAPHLFSPEEAPRYTRGLTANLAIFAVMFLVIGSGAGWIFLLNKKHAAMRVQMGKPAKIVDLSMEKSGKLTAENEAVNDTDGTGVGDRGFEDCTDLKNEDFVYVY